jgi:methylmalonyl-CoA mutase
VDDERTIDVDRSDATEADWRRLVDKVLKGAPIERLVTTTLDGVEVQPLYRRATGQAGKAGQTVAAPGEAPFVRGIEAGHDTSAEVGDEPFGAWDVRVVIDHPDPSAANEMLLDQLEQGANSALIRLASGLRTLTPGGAVDGLVVTSAQQFNSLLDGVLLDVATVQIDAGASALEAAAWLETRLESSSRCDLGIDPLGVLALTGDDSMCGEAGRARLGDLIESHDVQELAIMTAAAAEYLRWFADGDPRVVPVDRFTDNTAVSLVLTADQFSTIAKLRAARVLWAHLLDACGDPAARRDLIGVTSRYMLAERDPWVNMLRNTTAALAGVVGGAEAIAVLPYDAVTGVPGALGRRAARNTQLLLQDESRVGNPIDPAGGSPYVEQLTEEFVGLAWSMFVDIEAQGGLASSLRSGWLQRQIAARREERDHQIQTRQRAITGVSEFPLLEDLSGNLTSETLTAEQASDAAASVDGYLQSIPRPTPQFEPLSATRASLGWEQLRARVEANIRIPVVTVCLGTAAQFGARQQWAENLLLAAGFRTTQVVVSADGVADAAAGVVATEAAAMFLCGNDAAYAEVGTDGLGALVVAASVPVVAAGTPGAFGESQPGADIDGVVFANARSNVFEQMTALADRLMGQGRLDGQDPGDPDQR